MTNETTIKKPKIKQKNHKTTQRHTHSHTGFKNIKLETLKCIQRTCVGAVGGMLDLSL